MCFSDSDYAGDPDSCRSASGYILFVKGVPIAWKLKAQRSVTLSAAKDVYYQQATSMLVPVEDMNDIYIFILNPLWGSAQKLVTAQ